MTPVEILLASDKELNEYMSIKKYASYRKEVKWDSKRTERLKEFKTKIADRTRSTDTPENPASEKKKRKGKKERMKLRAASSHESSVGDDKANEFGDGNVGDIDERTPERKSRPRKKRRRNESAAEAS